MLSDSEAACVTIAPAPCLKKEASPLDQIMVQRPQYIRENLIG